MRSTRILLGGLVAVGLFAGCVIQQAKMPTSQIEYDRMARADRERFPPRTIFDYNLQRALNKDLSPAKRVDSLRVVTSLEVNAPELEYQLALVLGDPTAGPELRKVALEFLLGRDHPGLAEYVVKLLPRLKSHSSLRDRILDWLIKHPQPQVLAEIVKLWAAEPSVTGPNEPRFRRIVETMTNKYWDDALLDSINSPVFFARGSALELLASRAPLSLVRLRISRTEAKTDAFKAMQDVLKRFDYLPTTATELLQTAWVYTQRPGLLSDAGRLARGWEESSAYRFNIRDTHILSRLAKDPLRPSWRPSKLIGHLTRIFGASPHVRHTPSARGAVDDYTEDFAQQVDALTMTDLWNLYLLREMLGRERVQMALRITANRDRADKSGAWGGLIFYQNGQAEAMLYPFSPRGGQNDLIYSPGRRAVIDGRDALCRFNCHFEKADNTKRAGPGPEEIRDAMLRNYYGLIITSVNKEVFCAHYYNPDGLVVSMGTFRFR